MNPQGQRCAPLGNTLPRRDLVLLAGRAIGATVATALLAACGNTASTPMPPTMAAAVTATTRQLLPTPTATAATPQASPATRLAVATATASAGATATAPLAHPAGASPTVTASRAAATPVALPTPGTAEVKIVDFAFVPATLTVPVGTTVVWTNTGVEHTTTSRDNVWASEVMEPGDTFRFTFTQPGTYPYLCALHPDMVAVVIVR